MNNNVLEFFVKMKDMMSGGLVKLGQNAQQTFSKISSNVKAAEKTTNTYSKTLGSLYDRMNDLKKIRMDNAFGTKAIKQATYEIKQLQREIDKLEGKKTGKAGGGILSMAKSFLPAISLAAVGSFAMSSVKAANTFEAQKTSYGVLTGNKGLGDALAGDLRGLKENTIMGPAVYKNAQTMLGFGIAAKDVTHDLRMLGDISMGDANRLQHLTLAFSEVQAAGKLSGKEVRQFVNSGFNPLMEISKMTGKSMATVRHEMHEGKISAQMLTQAFESATGVGGRFHGMLEKMANTGAGRVQMLEGKIASFKIALGERLQPAFGQSVETMAHFVGWAKKLIEIPIEQKIQDQINKIRGLHIEMLSSNTSHARQVEILRELNDINPNIVKGINEQKISYGQLADNIDRVVKGYENQKVAEILAKQNGELFDNVALFKNKRQDADANIMADLGAVGDKRLLDPSMSYGQKQILAQQILKQRVKGEGGNFSFTPTANAKLLTKLTGDISNYNSSQGFLDYNSGKVKTVQDQIAAARAIYQQTTGVASMASAIDSKNKNGKGSNANAGESATGVAGGITSGGPRTINIHGVKFADKIEFHASSGDAVMKDGERKMMEMYLRLLNSGASVQ